MRKGDIIFWTVEGLEVNKEKLEDLGLGDYAPRNDFKAALIKALRHTFKGNDRMYKRYNDRGREVSFGVFFETTSGTDINISKEFQFKLDKKTGEVSNLSQGSTPEVLDRVLERYRHEKKHLDSKQFTETIKRYIKKNGWAISLRKNGGIYFIDHRFEESKKHIQKVFKAFPEAHLSSVEVGTGDISAEEALERAASSEVFGEIETLVNEIDEEFNKGTITKRKLESKKKQADEILKKISVHEHNLRTKAKTLKVKATSVAKALAGVTSKVEDNLVDADTFSAALEAI